MENNLLENYLSSVRRPSRYLGRELFSIIKNPRDIKLRFALAFPDLYEIGMSYLGIKILYHILNRRPEVWAERFFTPAPDMAQVMQEHSIRLPSLESGRVLKDFDIIGFSLPYELGYTNVLQMLSLGGVPLRSRDRKEEVPLVIAGGPCTFNPEPMAGFFDALVIGEGEEVVEEICEAWLTWKAAGQGRHDLLASLAGLPGLYVPAVHQPGKETRKPTAVYKRIIPDLNRVGYPHISPLPFMQVIHDRLSIEIARGCTRGCRFCQAGVIYRPVRERSPEQVYQLTEEGLKRTGYDETTLLSLSSGDYTCLEGLLPALMEGCEAKKVAVSLPSLRVDTLSPGVIEQILRVRKTGFTIAPEAGTQRLRDVINKNITEEEILETARMIFSLGWRVLKLYFMIGLPGETREDLEGLIDLVKKIEKAVRKKGRRMEIHVALSTFIPKPHTPFQWAGQISMEEALDRLTFLRSALKNRNIQVKWNDTRQSFLEGILSRGDQRIGEAIRLAFQKGGRLDGWGEYFSWDIWQQSFTEAGVDPFDYLQEKSHGEAFPWDFVRSGIEKEYLWEEYQRGLSAESTGDCRQGDCQQCGVCPTLKVTPIVFKAMNLPTGRSFRASPKNSIKKFRLLVTKTGPSRFLGHLEWKEAIIRAFRRSELTLAFSEGFHPLPRFTFGPALPVGLISLGEYIDLQLMDWPSQEIVKNSLPEELFPGTRIMSISEVPLNSPFPRELVHRYQVELEQAEVDSGRAETFLTSPSWPTERPGKKPEIIDLRGLVEKLLLLPGHDGKVSVQWTTKAGPGGDIRPELILRSVFNTPETTIQKLSVVKSIDDACQ
jgi:radical SAM family uncharacterized protein/radical SAM-linked protein